MDVKRVTLADAVALAEHTPMDSIDFAHNIFAHYMQNYSTGNGGWIFICALNTVFCAGRIAGIRAERARRRGGKKHGD